MPASRRAPPFPLAAIGLALALGWTTQVGAQPTPEARGRALVAGQCSRCHAVDAAGDSPNPQAPPFRRLHERFPVENLAEALVEGIRVSHTRMPQFQFSEQDASDIIAYLKSIQSDAGAPASATAVPPK